MTRTLIWLTFARSGSNHLTDLLAALPGIASMTELFSPSAVQVHSFQDDAPTVIGRILALCRGLSVPLPSGGSDLNAMMAYPPLIAAVREDPVRTISILRSANAASLDSLKLFPGHLPDRAVELLLVDPAAVPCALLRNPLDSFISHLKRRQTKAFRTADTTAIKPRIGLNAYRRYLEQRAAWLSLIARHQDRLAVCISYEHLIALGAAKDQAAWLQRVLAGRGLIGGAAPPAAIREGTVQDRGTHPSEKIANWAELSRRCAEAGIDPFRDLVPWPAMTGGG